jgi:hypothetical protein
VIAAIGSTGARVLLGCLAALLLSFAAQSIARGGNGTAGVLLCWLALTGVILPIWLESAYVLPEVWSGILMGLSLAAFGCERKRTAVCAGIAALFFRELAAAYVLVSVVWAWRNRARGELIAWTVGIIAYTLFYAGHLIQVLPRITPDAVAHSQSWIAFGGASFVISLVQMNVWLLLLPQWVSGLALAAAAFGWAAAKSEWERRVAVCGLVYLVIFSIVGMPINQYWGAQISPLIALGIGQFPAAIRQFRESLATRAAVEREAWSCES